MMCQKLGQHQCPFTARTVDKCAAKTPHTPAQHDEMTAQFKLYGLDPESAYWIRDSCNETQSKDVIRRHMEKLYLEADRGNRNREVPKHCNIQIATVSYALMKLADICGYYTHSHLHILCSAC